MPSKWVGVRRRRRRQDHRPDKPRWIIARILRGSDQRFRYRRKYIFRVDQACGLYMGITTMVQRASSWGAMTYSSMSSPPSLNLRSIWNLVDCRADCLALRRRKSNPNRLAPTPKSNTFKSASCTWEVRRKTTKARMPTRMSAVPNLEIMSASEPPHTITGGREFQEKLISE